MSRRIFIVMGGKGGVGATTTAIKLVQRFPAPGERVIVDGDLSGKRSLAVWYDLAESLDLARVIGTATIAPSKAGPLVMELARTYEDGLLHTSATVVRALTALSNNALIVVDAPQPFAATIRPLVNAAAMMILLVEPSPMGISSARALLGALDRFGIPPARIARVRSDVEGKSPVTRADIERELGMTVKAELINDRDRRSTGLFDGFMTMLAAAPLRDDAAGASEKPMFDRRLESGKRFS